MAEFSPLSVPGEITHLCNALFQNPPFSKKECLEPCRTEHSLITCFFLPKFLDQLDPVIIIWIMDLKVTSEVLRGFFQGFGSNE